MTTKKTLSESAAEILAASVAASGKKQDPSPADVSVSNIDPPPAVTTKEAPKPGVKAAVASKKDDEVKAESTEETEVEGTETLEEEEISEEEEVELTEEEIEEYLSTLTEEELEALADLQEGTEEDETDEEEEDSEPEEEMVTEDNTEETVVEEEVVVDRKEALKALVAENMGSCKDDIDALFSGESLSEEFKTKATTIFEAAVRSRVDAIVEKIDSENSEIMESTVGELEAQMTEQVDEYLNHVVESWMEENKLAVEQGVRSDIAEDFMNGLKNLFVEHYIEVPEEKTDLVDELAAQVADAQGKLDESTKTIEGLQKALNESKAIEVLRKSCEGLTEVQVSKIKTLAEGVDFTTEGEYSQKLAVIRESYFPSGKKVSTAPQALVETTEVGTSNTMDKYVTAISKQLPK